MPGKDLLEKTENVSLTTEAQKTTRASTTSYLLYGRQRVSASEQGRAHDHLEPERAFQPAADVAKDEKGAVARWAAPFRVSQAERTAGGTPDLRISHELPTFGGVTSLAYEVRFVGARQEVELLLRQLVLCTPLSFVWAWAREGLTEVRMQTQNR